MARVGVLLSGCGVQDGSEIYESVLTILALERAGAEVVAMAPDVEQADIVNHYTGAETRLETREVLAEAARIVRGKIISIGEVSAHELDALIIVGGYGVVKNLCTYATDGDQATVNPDVERIIRELHGLGKPIGAMCAGPIVVALVLRDKKPTLTAGTDGQTALGLERLGAQHVVTQVDQIYVDANNNLISTAAFLIADTALQAETGINKLVEAVLQAVAKLSAA